MTLKQNAITVAIAVIFSVFIMVTIDAFYERPKYENFCNESLHYKAVPAIMPSNCTYDYRNDNECASSGGIARYDYDSAGCQKFNNCDYCSKAFDTANKKYSNDIFIIYAIIGLIAIVFGVYYSIDFLGTGFMFSGIFLMFFGTVQNFESLNRFTKPIIILVELCLILFIAYKKVISRPEEHVVEPSKQHVIRRMKKN